MSRSNSAAIWMALQKFTAFPFSPVIASISGAGASCSPSRCPLPRPRKRILAPVASWMRRVQHPPWPMIFLFKSKPGLNISGFKYKWHHRRPRNCRQRCPSCGGKPTLLIDFGATRAAFVADAISKGCDASTARSGDEPFAGTPSNKDGQSLGLNKPGMSCMLTSDITCERSKSLSKLLPHKVPLGRRGKTPPCCSLASACRTQVTTISSFSKRTCPLPLSASCCC
mmetsp:Transcript_135304/g.350589  ORF Transcript_135304/g.350589 Transcript_135304/m.350589 type:complete len:226 (-) Transcript_135304:385-1062(-)